MAIKRFYATADTTITNAYAEDLKTRGDKSNMGKADTLEVFTIFDQVETVTTTKDGRVSVFPHREQARIIIKFDVDAIVADTEISSDAKYYLRLFNAVHPHTLPDNYSLDVYALDEAFDEGYGKDADNYSDGGVQPYAASWVARKYDSPPLIVPATGSFQVDINPTTDITVVIGGHTLTVASNVAGAIQTAADIANAINDDTNMALLVDAEANIAEDGQVDIKALNIGGDKINLQISSDTGNLLRNSSNWTGIGNGGTNGSAKLQGGSDTISWSVPGGAYGDSTPDPVGTFEFVHGAEDMVVDITSYIQDVKDGAYSDSGLLIKL